MRPIFSPIPILGNDMKVPKVTHRESPSYNNRFRDIMASRNPSLNPKPGDADNEEPDRIEESNKDEQDKVLIKNMSHYMGTENLYTSSISLLAVDVDVTPTDVEFLNEGIAPIFQHTDGDVMKLGVMDGEAVDIFDPGEEVSMGNNPDLRLINYDVSRTFLHDSEAIDPETKGADIYLIESDNKLIEEYNQPDSGVVIDGSMSDHPDKEDLSHGTQIHVVDNRILNNAVHGQDRLLKQIALSADHEEPDNVFKKTGEDNKLTREAQIRQLYKEESTYDRLLTLEKGLSDQDSESEYDSGSNSDSLNNAILDNSLDFSKALDISDSVGTIEAVEQLAKRIVVTLNKRASELAIEVQPNHLGKLILKVAIEDGNLAGKILTNNQLVRDFLQRNLSELLATLEDQGFVFTSLDVNVGGQSNYEQFHQTRTIRQGNKKSITPSDIFMIKANGLTEQNQIDCLA